MFLLITKLRQGNVFTPICQSFCSRRVVSASVHTGIHIPGRTTPWQIHSPGPGSLPPLDICTPWPGPPARYTPQADTPSGRYTPTTVTAADGTHPTGMFSRLIKIHWTKRILAKVGFEPSVSRSLPNCFTHCTTESTVIAESFKLH